MAYKYNPFTNRLDFYETGGGGGAVTSVSGTTNRITATPTTGDVVVDIASTYVGQSSITTLGTITTGVWNGSVIGLAFGGTNANLTASNGGVFTSTASAGSILPAPATSQIGSLEWFNGVPQASTPSKRCYFYDDFFYTSSQIYSQHSNGAGVSINDIVLDSAHPGSVEIQLGTDVNGNFSLSTNNQSQIILGGGSIYFETCLNIQNLASAIDDYTLALGMHDGWVFTNPPQNGFWFGYNRSTSTNWIINSANAGTTTSTTSSTAVASGWTRLGIFYNLGTTTATFYVNGTSVGTINTNISTNPIGLCFAGFKTLGITNRIFYLDYWSMFQQMTAAR